jgi:hypothetical protein
LSLAREKNSQLNPAKFKIKELALDARHPLKESGTASVLNKL